MSSSSEMYFTYIYFIYVNNKRCNMNLNKAFALKVTKLLQERGISKYKLEKETGITHSALRYIFNEVNSDVKFSTIVKACNALGVTIIEFFNDEIFRLENLDFE